ncbi:MAG TPA: 4-hydroxy-3-methylbut-2-enyl diphosphate reductase [Solirubrobacteraceae bacterium]|nr:4-hydroxy-3-methylbut-2-enyl diphosphate reductase [Solirubrobacteraceae bacterium]
MGGVRLTVLAPMAIEAAALRRAGMPVSTVGMGPASARRGTRALGVLPGPVLVAGLAGALAADLQVGDVVLASEIRAPDGKVYRCADPTLLVTLLREAGLRVHVGPVACARRVVRGGARRELARTTALCVDMESAWLAEVAGRRPLTVMRVILDTGERELHRPLTTLAGLARALGVLTRAAACLARWSALLGDREVLLAAPRASCAGVDRAVEVVERVLCERGAPVYVRRQIVHNAHVVGSLERRGAIFVEELAEVPPGATVIFSAHGVSPAVRAEAAARGLEVIDATCPLVAKVHAEARRFAAGGFEIVLIGHAGHDEVEGTLGEAPDQMRLLASAEEVTQLEVADPERVAYLTQTTLAIDETATVVEALRERFPSVSGPASSDICYATQNRQDAVRALAAECDLVLVVGSRNSSNSCRLVEVARRAGVTAELIENASELDPRQLSGARRIGLSAGASAPEHLVQGVISALAGLGELSVSERRVAREDIHFKLPPQVRSPEVIPCPSP